MQAQQYAEASYVFTYPSDRSRVRIIGRFLYRQTLILSHSSFRILTDFFVNDNIEGV